MKHLLATILTGMTCLYLSSCSGFLDTKPYDALASGNTWKTEDDVEKFLIGCYDGWLNVDDFFYWDTTTDIGFANFPRDSWRYISNGGVTAGNTYSFYDFYIIRSCNTLLEKIKDIPFEDDSKKNDIIGQAKTIRAYKYFVMNWWLGGVPIIDNYETAEDAQVERDSEEAVVKFIFDELAEAIPLLRKEPAARGRIAQGTALALQMRAALYYENYELAKQSAEAISALNQYELDADYNNLFLLEGQDSKEIIMAMQHIDETKTLFHLGMCFYNNAEGGWSGCVPCQDLVDIYEMVDGLPQEESELYDPHHPYNNRDPRMEMTILYPGRDWDGGIFNSLDKNIVDSKGNINVNPNYPTVSDNASDTGLSWAKYVGNGRDYYPDKFATSACPILFRYAEVLLSWAEAENELHGPSKAVYEKLNQIRNRVGMPDVDENKYSTKETLRELIRRERCVEFAGEGLRRADIVRWKDESGKLMAETVLNRTIYRLVGTVDYDEEIPGKRATVDVNNKVELDKRVFKPFNRYVPIPLNSMDKNPKLVQNEGY